MTENTFTTKSGKNPTIFYNGCEIKDIDNPSRFGWIRVIEVTTPNGTVENFDQLLDAVTWASEKGENDLT